MRITIPILVIVFLMCSTGYSGSTVAAVDNKGKIKAMLAEGKQAWNENNAKLASVIYQKVLELDPKNAESLYYMARINLGRNFFKKGVDFFRRAILASPENAVLHLNLARVYEESHYYTLAIDEYKKVMELVPNQQDPVYQEARQRLQFTESQHQLNLEKIQGYLDEGRRLYYLGPASHEDAKKQFTKALAIYPTYAEPYFFLGNIFLRGGDYGAGLKHIETSRWNAPNNARVQLTLGRVYEEGRQFEDARNEYRQVIRRLGEAAPESLEAKKRLALIEEAVKEIESKEAVITRLLEEAKTLFEKGEMDQAEEKFKKVVALDIGRAEAYYFLGRIELARGEYRKGGEYTEKAVQYSPRNIGLILTLARIYEQGGAMFNARKYYNRAIFYADPESAQAKEARTRLNLMGEGIEPQLLRVIQANPGDIQARIRLAQYLLQTKKNDEAVGQLEAIVLIGGDEGIVQAARVNLAGIYRSYGKVFAAQGKTEDSITLFEQSLEYEPESADTYYLLGVGYARMQKIDRGIEFFEKALELDPRHVDALANLGLAYHVQKKYELAIDAYSRAAAYDENTRFSKNYVLQIREVLVEKYRAEKRFDEAAVELQDLIALFPKQPKYYLSMMQVNAGRGELKGVVAYGEKLLELLPKNDRIRMWVAQVYMQLLDKDKAKAHLQIISRTAKDKKLSEQAENMLAQIARSQKLRFNYNLAYNLSTGGILEELDRDLPTSSNLSFSVTSGFSVKDVRFNLTLAPRYSVNHQAQSDSFNIGFTAAANFAPYYKFPLTAGYSYSENGNLLTEVKNSFQQTVFVSPRAFPIKVPRKFWLLNDGELDRDKEHVTLTLSTQFRYSDQDTFNTQSIFLMRILDVNATLRQSYRSLFNRVGSFTMAYLYNENRNKSVLGRDLAFKKNQLQLSMSQALFFGVSGGVNYRVAFDNYTNRDSDFGEHRHVVDQSASASLSRSLFKGLSLSIAYSWTKRDSNLDRGVIRGPNRQPVALQPSNFGSRETRGNSWSSSLNFNFRF